MGLPCGQYKSIFYASSEHVTWINHARVDFFLLGFTHLLLVLGFQFDGLNVIDSTNAQRKYRGTTCCGSLVVTSYRRYQLWELVFLDRSFHKGQGVYSSSVLGVLFAEYFSITVYVDLGRSCGLYCE